MCSEPIETMAGGWVGAEGFPSEFLGMIRTTIWTFTVQHFIKRRKVESKTWSSGSCPSVLGSRLCVYISIMWPFVTLWLSLWLMAASYSIPESSGLCANMGWFTPREAAQKLLSEWEWTSILDIIPKQQEGPWGRGWGAGGEQSEQWIELSKPTNTV